MKKKIIDHCLKFLVIYVKKKISEIVTRENVFKLVFNHCDAPNGEPEQFKKSQSANDDDEVSSIEPYLASLKTTRDVGCATLEGQIHNGN